MSEPIKKALALMLALVLCLGLLPARAIAAEPEHEDPLPAAMEAIPASESAETEEETPPPAPETTDPVETPVPEEDQTEYFRIRNGVLDKYTGSGGAVVIPNGVTSIRRGVFAGNTEVTSVTIPEGVTKISENAFSGCTALTSVTIPEGVTEISGNAFSGCTALTEVNFPDSLTTIGGYAFSRCAGLTAIEFSNGPLTIGTAAFSKCSGLTQLWIPAGVERIDKWAFQDCTSLKQVTIENEAIGVSFDSFENCPALELVTVPRVLTGNFALSTAVPATEYFLVKNGALTKYYGPGGDVAVPDGVTTIQNAFQQNKTLTSITLPSSLKTIEESAFYCCTNLTSVTIQGDLDSIGDEAFRACGSLEKIDLPDSLTSLGERAFGSCTSLTEIYIPEGLTKIPAFAFENCTSLAGVHIPANVQELGVSAFSLCRSLAKVTIDNKDILIVGDTTFSGCDRLKEIDKGGTTITLTANKQLPHSLTELKEEVERNRQSAIASCQNSSFYQKRLKANQAFLLEHISEQDYTHTIVTDEVQALSDRLCSGLSTDYEKAYALHDWVVNNIYYDYVAMATYHPVIPAQEVLDRKAYVCSGYAVLMQALCWAQKIPCVCVFGNASGYHAWNAVRIDGEWLWIDATWDSSNKYYGDGQWSSGEGKLDYFLCSTEFISTDHEASFSSYTAHLDRRGGTTYTYKWCYVVNGINANLPTQTPEETKQLIKQEEELEKRMNQTHLEELSKEVKEDKSLSSWAQAEVEQAILANLVPSELLSAYSSNITRQEFCALMVKLVERKSGLDISAYAASKGFAGYNMPFTDTADSTVGYAYTLGIVKGTSKTTFNPNGSITRQEAATMLSRTAKLLGMTSNDPQHFRDAEQIADWAKEGVDFVSGLVDATSKNAVMGGTGNGKFSPLGTYTREQAILTSLRLFNCGQ